MQTELFVERIFSLLDDIQQKPQISQNTFRKKRMPAEVATALNLADIDLCAELTLEREAAVFVPKDVTYLFLRAGESYSYGDEYADSIAASEVVNANIVQEQLYLNNEAYLDVSAITGSEIFIYDEYPPKAYGTGDCIPVILKGLHHHAHKQAAVLDRDVPALILAHGLKKDGFAVFNAQVRPSFLEIKEGFSKEDLNAYRIRTPDYAHNVLLRRTMQHLLPGEFELVDMFTRAGQLDEQLMYQRKAGGGPVTYIPKGSYSF